MFELVRVLDCGMYVVVNVAVSGDNNDVLLGVAARDVSLVTSGARGHVSPAALTLLLMPRPPYSALQQEGRRHTHKRLSNENYRTSEHVRRADQVPRTTLMSRYIL